MKRYILIPILALMFLITGSTVDGCLVEVTNDPLDVLLDEDSKTQVVDSDGDIITIDEITGAITTVDFAHHELHEGDLYSYCEVTDLGNGASRNILIRTISTTKIAHIFLVVQTELETGLFLYEDTIVSNNGTDVVEQNRNRNSANTATIVVSHTPTVSNDGTLLCVKHWGSGRGAGGGDRSENEWLLKTGANYLLRVTNATANNNQVSIELIWYEHTSKD